MIPMMKINRKPAFKKPTTKKVNLSKFSLKKPLVRSNNSLPVYTMEDWDRDKRLQIKPGQAMTEEVYDTFIENSLISPWGDIEQTNLDLTDFESGYYTNNEEGGLSVWVHMKDGRYVFLGDYPYTILPSWEEDLWDAEDERRHYLYETIRYAKNYEDVWDEIIEYNRMENRMSDVEERMSKDKDVKNLICSYQDYMDDVWHGNNASMMEIIEMGSLFYIIEDPEEHIASAFDPDNYESDSNGNPMYDEQEKHFMKEMRRLHKKYYG